MGAKAPLFKGAYMLNKCTFIGNLGKDPEVRSLQSGKELVSFSVAVTKSWKDKNSGQKMQETQWINCTSFISTEFIKNYLSKGSKVYVEAEYKLETYEKNGQQVQSPKFIVKDIKALSKSEGQGNQGYTQPNHQAPLDDQIPF